MRDDSASHWRQHYGKAKVVVRNAPKGGTNENDCALRELVEKY